MVTFVTMVVDTASLIFANTLGTIRNNVLNLLDAIQASVHLAFRWTTRLGATFACADSRVHWVALQ